MSRFVRTHVDDLQLGMFVADLDRPWIDTPFLMQGFTIKTVEELAALRQLCTTVDVDIGLSQTPKNYDPLLTNGGAKRSRVVTQMFGGKRLVSYEDVFTFEQEMVSAEKVFRDYEVLVGDLYQGIARNGSVDMSAVRKTVDEVVDSIMRNADACMLLSAIRNKDSYSYSHAMASSILAAAVGRQIGLPIPDIKTLAQGSLLCDVGKLNISSRILNKNTPLSTEEVAIVRSHVDQGLELLSHSRGVSPEVLSIVAYHHERHNGSGYPNGTAGAEIPPMARIAGIVDCYDAMISDRAYARGVSPADAISKLYTMRDVDFQGELIEEFIQAVGIYPVGSFVALTDGRVGIVVTEHRRRRLRPRVMVLLDGEGMPATPGTYVNLLEETEDRLGRPLEILKGIEPMDYDIDPSELVF
ncbi:HD-GYP domain-containing protein [Mangrovimicrobium sediminis]|uniref:HD-GYP domain-containing protein n=1 Tax=Mangrovimicrobium sediminis TaxID=2562682 RepID=A0A4Z0M0Y6_9GAMM|nr:HD-GYP domain-containing protein [Haliea sp. SAOS-164]TGD72955.1 HD-GYP domain-containing protein [Haliea sp. SAOS-164]